MVSFAKAGYLSEEYARAVAAPDAEVHLLPASGSYALSEPVPQRPELRDLRAPYPLLCCDDPAGLAVDLERALGAVSMVAILDPLVDAPAGVLERAFPDLLRPFKRHYVVDLDVPSSEATSQHHRRNVARAARVLDVGVVPPSPAATADWVRLYSELAVRHGVRGPAGFDERSLSAQLRVPGAVVVQAASEGGTCGMSVWYVQGDSAYYHLGASDADGYRERASFAMFATALRHLRELGVRRVDLGGSAGATDAADGLARFKQGWATETRSAWLGGRVLDRPTYRALMATGTPSGWFPGYRGFA